MALGGDGLAAVIGFVFLNKLRQIFRKLIERINGIRRTDWNTRTAVDALHGIDIEGFRFLEAGFVRFGMDAVRRAGVNAERVFGATFGDYVCHTEE
jgi:hypothetical protein